MLEVSYAQRAGKESMDGQAGLEGDVQDVFFNAMTLEPNGRRRIVKESDDTFLVDVNARTPTALPKQKPADDGGRLPPPPRG